MFKNLRSGSLFDVEQRTITNFGIQTTNMQSYLMTPENNDDSFIGETMTHADN
tara:strand:+ start:1061 stop:1219 length:159 start_codon:yes stop_codon:yes gene_type:complete